MHEKCSERRYPRDAADLLRLEAPPLIGALTRIASSADDERAYLPLTARSPGASRPVPVFLQPDPDD